MTSRQYLAQVLKIQGKAESLPPLEGDVLRVVKTEIEVEAVNRSQRLEGGKLTVEETKSAIVSGDASTK